MPLVRFQVRNEYGLSDPELYRGPTWEDPKPALDGVAVAGLVGILRQLGDLAEFAADVFHDLHEQVMKTGARGKEISSRIQRIESTIPSLEKAVQNQTSHMRFAYIAGCDWRANVRTVQSQLICSDLPQYMLDSYEECCDPPRLYLLDKFDNAGAGACLRRYSDPSYFRRAMASSEPVKPEKVKRKRKKKGSRLRSREIQEVFIPQESSSTQFASPGTDHLGFSDENISMTDAKSKSEGERESTFSDSETRVNFQVTDMHPTVYNELEYNGSSASTSNFNHSDAPVYVLRNERVENTADDDSQHDSLQELSAPSSSSVTWDEKTEIVKPTSPELCNEALLDRDQDAVSLPLDSESSNLDCENAKLGKSNQVYIEFDEGEIPVSLSYGNHFDNVTSETENYIDANSILESEIETDDEFLSKREVKTLPNCSYPDRKSELSELKETDSSLDCNDAQASLASCSSTDDYIPPRLSNLVPSDGFGHDQSMCVTHFVPKHDSSVKIDYNGSDISSLSGVGVYGGLNADMSPESSTVSEQVEVAENTEAKIFRPEDPPAASLKVPSFRCWTNGGILGLEPSKPPDFGILNGRSIENSETLVCGEGMTRNLFYVDESITSHDISVKNSQESFQGLSLGELDKNREISSERTYANHGLVLKETNATNPGLNLVGYASIDSQFNGFEQSISASVSELAHRFLANSLQTRISVNNVDVPRPSELVYDDCRKSERISLQNVHQGVPNGVLSHTSRGSDNEKMEVESLVKLASNSSPNPGSSSPPLEHMNISFQPVNGFQTSKLKLEFNSGNHHDCVRDLTFPSLQLIPGPSVVLDSASESDDDTFCRSSYSSQDLLSLQSESNSEVWGEERSQKHEVSDNSCRIAPTTMSICSTLEFEKMDKRKIEHLEEGSGTLTFYSSPIRDLPGIDSVIFPKKHQEDVCDSFSVVPIDSKPLLSNEFPSPQPPPLPPMQWLVIKQSSSLEAKVSTEAEVVNHLDACIPSLVTLQKKEQDVQRLSCDPEAVIHSSKKTHNQQNLNGHRELNCTSISKKPDEREHLLQQIRNKSFNLRHMVIEKQSETPEPPTNVNVIAILKKVDAIRQSFISREKGRDNDNWRGG